MNVYTIHHIDSFTNTLFGGNPTVTVLDAQKLTDEQMRKIAREMNLSETGFVLPALRDPKADFRLRFFTPPGDEIKFCGHATIGALASIAKDRLYGCASGIKKLRVETNAGSLEMEIDMTDPANPVYKMDLPAIDMAPATLSYRELAEGLGIAEDLIDHSKPLLIEKNNNYLYFASANLQNLGEIKPDMTRAARFSKEHGFVVICAMAPETFDPQSQIHARGFAPLVGVPEDPFTGSMQGGLAAYALKHGLAAPESTWIRSEQGHFMQRPGFVRIEIVSRYPLRFKLHAEAVHVFTAKLTVR